MALASKPLTRAIVILLIATTFTACSSMGTAVVTEIDGLPCFSIPKSWTTRNGLPMHGLAVVQRNAPGAAPYSRYVWTFSVEPAGASIITRPGKCMRYGATPRLATQGESQPLEPFQVYSVFINARPDDSGMRGYIAEFCIKPAEGGKPRVLVVSFDEKTSSRRYDLCDGPAQAATMARTTVTQAVDKG